MLITHDPEEAFTLVDRIALMHAGRVLQYGAPRDLLRHPADAQATRLLGLQNISEEHYIPPQAITVCAAGSDSPAEDRIVCIAGLPEACRPIFVHRRYGELTADLDRQQAGWLDSPPDNDRIGVTINDRQIVRFAGQASTGDRAVWESAGFTKVIQTSLYFKYYWYQYGYASGNMSSREPQHIQSHTLKGHL